MSGKPAARLTDFHTCPLVDGLVPHVGGPIISPGCPTVLIGGLPAARVGDMAVCNGPPDVIAEGSPTVFIGGAMAARLGDATVHGGVIVEGDPTVLIGDGGGGGDSGGGNVSLSAHIDSDGSSIDLAKTWLDASEAAASFGDDDNKLFLLSAHAEVDSEVSYDLDERKFDVTLIRAEVDASLLDAEFSQSEAGGAVHASEAVQIEHVENTADLSAAYSDGKFEARAQAGASASLLDAELSQSAAGGAVQATETVQIGLVDDTAGLSATYSDGEFEAGAQAGVEAMLAQATVQSTVRITAKTIFDNTVGRLTHTSAPASWDKGIEIGAQGQAGYGASVTASATAQVESDRVELTAGAKVGLGFVAGVNLNLGIIW